MVVFTSGIVDDAALLDAARPEYYLLQLAGWVWKPGVWCGVGWLTHCWVSEGSDSFLASLGGVWAVACAVLLGGCGGVLVCE